MPKTIEGQNIECLSISPGWNATNLPYNYTHTTERGMLVILHSVKNLSHEQKQQIWDLLFRSEREMYNLKRELNWEFSVEKKFLEITLFSISQPYNPGGHGQRTYNPFYPGLLGQAQYYRENLNGIPQLATRVEIPLETFSLPLGSDNDNDFAFRHELGHVHHFYLNGGSTSIWPAVSDGFADFIAELNGSNLCDAIWKTKSMPLLRAILIRERNFRNQYILGRWFIEYMREKHPDAFRELLSANYEKYPSLEARENIGHYYILAHERSFAEWIAEKQCSCPGRFELCESDQFTTTSKATTVIPPSPASLPANQDIMQALLGKNLFLQQYIKGYKDIGFVFFSDQKNSYCALMNDSFYCTVDDPQLTTQQKSTALQAIQRASIRSIMEMYIYGDNCAATLLEIRLSSQNRREDGWRLQEDIIKIVQKGYQWNDLQQAATAIGLSPGEMQFLTSEYQRYQFSQAANWQSHTAATQNCTSHRASLASQYPQPTATFIPPTAASTPSAAELLQNLLDKNPSLQQYIKKYKDVAFVFFADQKNSYCRLMDESLYCTVKNPQLTAQQKSTALQAIQRDSIRSIMEMYIYEDNCAATPVEILLSYLRPLEDEQLFLAGIIKRTRSYRWSDLQHVAEAIGVSSDEIQFLANESQRCAEGQMSCARSCAAISNNLAGNHDEPLGSCVDPKIEYDDFSVIKQMNEPPANQPVIEGTTSTADQLVTQTARRTPLPLLTRLGVEIGIGVVNGLTPLALNQLRKRLKQRYPEHTQKIDAIMHYVAHPLLSSGINLARIPLSGAVFWAEDASLAPSIGFYFASNLAISGAIKAIQYLIQRWVGEGKITQAFNFIIYLSSVAMLFTSQDFSENPLPATYGYIANVVASMATVALIACVDGLKRSQANHQTDVPSRNSIEMIEAGTSLNADCPLLTPIPMLKLPPVKSHKESSNDRIRFFQKKQHEVVPLTTEMGPHRANAL